MLKYSISFMENKEYIIQNYNLKEVYLGYWLLTLQDNLKNNNSLCVDVNKYKKIFEAISLIEKNKEEFKKILISHITDIKTYTFKNSLMYVSTNVFSIIAFELLELNNIGKKIWICEMCGDVFIRDRQITKHCNKCPYRSQVHPDRKKRSTIIQKYRRTGIINKLLNELNAELKENGLREYKPCAERTPKKYR